MSGFKWCCPGGGQWGAWGWARSGARFPAKAYPIEKFLRFEFGCHIGWVVAHTALRAPAFWRTIDRLRVDSTSGRTTWQRLLSFPSFVAKITMLFGGTLA